MAPTATTAITGRHLGRFWSQKDRSLFLFKKFGRIFQKNSSRSFSHFWPPFSSIQVQPQDQVIEKLFS
ncbi:hypothetical protein L3X38_032733 [Prunus dulcis]|uniref:Uncharacterized protein n=1 Tax=Prunus dulcis TaxID=3755 RepID=A0AAD4YW61_PRUDU|nr:hypothetical protein L3X38_032733 [Prunus dulcis]